MAHLLYWLAILFWALCAGGLAWYILGYATQITYVTLADGRRQARALPLVFRLLLPLAPNIEPLLRKPAFAPAAQAAAWQLTAAGYEGLLNGREFVALKMLIPAVAAILLALLFVPLGADAFPVWLVGTLLAFHLVLFLLDGISCRKHHRQQNESDAKSRSLHALSLQRLFAHLLLKVGTFILRLHR